MRLVPLSEDVFPEYGGYEMMFQTIAVLMGGMLILFVIYQKRRGE